MKKRLLRALPALLLAVCCLFSALGVTAGAAGFRYRHDPRLNARAMEDIVVDPEAVYGFSPSPYGSLKQYVDAFNWSDPAALEISRDERITYHESLESMYVMLENMRAEGASTEEIARTVSRMRNEIRMIAYAEDPEGLALARARNLEQYGHEDGPTPDELFEKYGSWETVIEKAFSANPGMDACLGLYDDYYSLYIAAGQVQEEENQSATREYAVARFVEAAGVKSAAGGPRLADFQDGGYVSTWFEPELSAAVSAGILRGYDDGTLRPREELRRVEAFVMLARCLPTLEKVREPLAFTDVPAWAKDDIDRLSAAGIVNGYGGGLLGSSDNLTVYQVGLLVERIEAAAPSSSIKVGAQAVTLTDDEHVTAVFEKMYAASGGMFCVDIKVQNKTDKTIWAYFDNVSVNDKSATAAFVSNVPPYVMAGRTNRHTFSISLSALGIAGAEDVKNLTFDLVIVSGVGEIERVKAVSLDF